MGNTLENIKNTVFKLRPVLKEIADLHSGESLSNYLRTGWQVPKSKPDRLFLYCLEQAVAEVYGKEIAVRARRQLENKPIVSTIDHHGIWNHPIFVNSALIYSLYFQPSELVLTLSTESVSLNNLSSWSGCLLEHDENLAIKRHSFFPDRLKSLPVFSAPAINKSGFKKVYSGMSAKTSELVSLLETESIYDCQDFSTQACSMSAKVWQAVFPSASSLLYLPLERLVSQYLLKIFEDPRHILTRLVASQEGKDLWRKYFFDEHTFLFWGIDAKGRRKAFTGLPDDFSAIIRQIQEKRVYASSPLCFAVLLSVGLTCVGGFTQTTWLTRIKKKLSSLLTEFDRLYPSARIDVMPTENFAETSLAWQKTQDTYIMPTAADLFLSGIDFYPKYQKLAQGLTLGQSLDLMLPTVYSVVVPKKAWLAGFNKIKMQQQIFEGLKIEI
ncbi:MAG: hypothetical protein HYZ51_04970 [Candidatus Doudnabacteria bacterium]|nr:hypothetical protein [Candidatus Doudnabacteria bacterium]